MKNRTGSGLMPIIELHLVAVGTAKATEFPPPRLSHFGFLWKIIR
jgi:hypothetical protein